MEEEFFELNHRKRISPRRIQVVRDDGILLANIPEKIGIHRVAEIISDFIISEPWIKLHIERVS